MGYKLTFMDNEVYSAQDINEHFGKLFSGGVSLLESGNVLADLNTMTSEIVGSGTLYDACSVVKTDNGYKISKGTAFMHDGSAITFDESGYEFTVDAGKYWYVYLERNEPENRIDIVISETKPTGEFVPLAQISASGEVYDRRKYAHLKVNSVQAGTLKKFDITYYATDLYKSEPYDVGNGNFSYLIMFDSEVRIGGTPYLLTAATKNVYELIEGEEVAVHINNPNGYQLGSIYVKKNGQLLETRMAERSGVNDYELHFGVI